MDCLVKAPPSVEGWGELEGGCLDREHRLERLGPVGCLPSRPRPQASGEDCSNKVCADSIMMNVSHNSLAV